MIQRIQSIYLLLVVIIACCPFFLPEINCLKSETGTPTEPSYMLFHLNGQNQLQIVAAWVLNVVSFLIPLIAFISIFLYKKRKLQLKFCYLNLYLMLAYFILFALYIWQAPCERNASLIVAFSLTPLFVLLNQMAIKGIKKDEALVKSLDRLR